MASAPCAAVAFYIVYLLQRLDDSERLVATGWAAGALLLALGQFLVSSWWLVRSALASSEDREGARLVRLLELPRRIELLASTPAWLTGALVFGVLEFGVNYVLVYQAEARLTSGLVAADPRVQNGGITSDIKLPDFANLSFFHTMLNDKWDFNTHFNFSLGARLEKWEGSQGNALYGKPSFQDVTPRIGVNYDPVGDRAWQYTITYATYAGKANAAIVTAGTYVGNPAVYLYGYTGPAVTGVTPGPTTSGFQRSDYDTVPFYVSDATKNTKLSDNFRAPLTIEYTAGIKHKISDSSNFTLLYIYRNQTRMFEDYVGMNGSVDIAGTPFSIIQWSNTGKDAMRVYRAIQGTWESTTNLYGGKLYLRGNATLSKLYGNYEGDGGNLPGGGTAIGTYPLATPNSAATAYGRLANDEPVRIKTQLLWNRPIGNNTLALGFNFDYASGHPYSFTRTANFSDPTNIYVDSAGQTYTRYYGGARGLGRFNDTYALDFSAQWDGKLGPKTGPTARLGYFIKFTAFNVLNNIQQATWNVDGNTTRVTPGATVATAGNGADVWIQRARFGYPTSPANYVGNRQIQLDLGIKF